MEKRRRGFFPGVLLSLGLLLTAGNLGATLRWDDLEATRLVKERDWLGLKLEVLGLRLSFPAYRIQLELDQGNAVVFTFLASSGLAEHLTDKEKRQEAEEMMNYHANGLREQVEKLLKEEFPAIWSGYESRSDFRGTFLGPGAEWDAPPQTIGEWKADQLNWKP